MEKFETLTGVAAPLRMVNIDTDAIIPKQFLKTIKRTGLGIYLFNDLRFDERGEEIAEFVLNQTPYRKAKTLITFENFGCGSSREHAPWALYDFGIRCLIAPSFADIFYNNCFKNGILPISLPKEDVENLMEVAERGSNATLSINLEQQTIVDPDGNITPFSLDPFRKQCLLDGLDDIDLTMAKANAIDRFEGLQRSKSPWLYSMTDS